MSTASAIWTVQLKEVQSFSECFLLSAFLSIGIFVWLACIRAGTISLDHWLARTRGGTAQMRRNRHARSSPLVRLHYRAWRRPAGRPPLQLFVLYGAGGRVLLYGRERRVSDDLRADDAALCLHRFGGLCRALRVALREARGTHAGVAPPPGNPGRVDALGRGLAPWPLPDPCHLARLRSAGVAARLGGRHQPRL